MANERIKNAAKVAGVKLWEIADVVGITDSTFSKQLRRELPEERQQTILAEIQRLASVKAGEAHGERH